MSPPPVLDLVVPVHNEEAALAACVHRLREHLVTTFPYPFRITVADNASTDMTPALALALAAELPEVRVVRLLEKGRGRALQRVWSQSAADGVPVLAYTDVDLSTDLDALWPLVAPLLSGHSDLAIGTRLHHASRVVRGTRREFVSRSYNLVLRTALGASFSDAQCGFKAVRGDVAGELLPLIEDTGWFFDTELLVLAQRSGLRVHEVPVDWYDDPDSRVDVWRTALDDLAGVGRMRRTHAVDSARIADLRSRLGRTPPAATAGIQAIRFALVGAATTVVHLGLFAVLAAMLVGDQLANAVALVLATVLNTGLNRRWTFGVRGPERALRHQLQGLVVFAVTWTMTAAALAGLAAAWPGAGTAVSTLAVGLASVVATVAKFVAMRSWMFGPGTAQVPGAEPDRPMSLTRPRTPARPRRALGG